MERARRRSVRLRFRLPRTNGWRPLSRLSKEPDKSEQAKYEEAGGQKVDHLISEESPAPRFSKRRSVEPSIGIVTDIAQDRQDPITPWDYQAGNVPSSRMVVPSCRAASDASSTSSRAPWVNSRMKRYVQVDSAGRDTMCVRPRPRCTKTPNSACNEPGRLGTSATQAVLSNE